MSFEESVVLFDAENVNMCIDLTVYSINLFCLLKDYHVIVINLSVSCKIAFHNILKLVLHFFLPPL